MQHHDMQHMGMKPYQLCFLNTIGFPVPMPTFKAELHTHCSSDCYESISYSYRDLIDAAAQQHFDILSFTHHHQYFYPDQAVAYAKKKGILLIPGCELCLEGYDILAYNFSYKQLRSIQTLADLQAIKTDKHLVIAPHPYFWFARGVSPLIDIYADLFDAIEWHAFYTYWCNYNIPAKRHASRYNKPMVGNSDVHELWQLGGAYTKITADTCTINSVLAAIKAGHTQVISAPMKHYRFMSYGMQCLAHSLFSTSRFNAQKVIRGCVVE